MNTEFDRVNALLRRCEERVLSLPYATVLDISFDLGAGEHVKLKHGELFIVTNLSGGMQRLPWTDAPFRLRCALLSKMGPFVAHVRAQSQILTLRVESGIRDAERAIGE